MVFHNHALEFVVGFDARELELFDNVRNLLEPVLILMLFGVIVCDYQKSAPFKQNHLVGVQSLTEYLQVFLQCFDIRQQERDNLGPGTIEGLVPDRCFEAVNLKSFVHFLQNVHLPLFESLISYIFAEHVHFVN